MKSFWLLAFDRRHGQHLACQPMDVVRSQQEAKFLSVDFFISTILFLTTYVNVIIIGFVVVLLIVECALFVIVKLPI